MKTFTALVSLMLCVVCGARAAPNGNNQGAATDVITDLMEKMNIMEQEVAALKSITPGAYKVAFSASLGSVGNTGPFDTDTALRYKNVFSNVGNKYDPATGIFTAPVKGLYFFRFSMHNSHRANSVVSLMKNNGHVVSVYDTYADDFHDMGSNAAVLPLEVGDTVYMRLAANRQVYEDSHNYNSFTGFLLFTN